jgi:hypothetical protein
MPADAAQLVRDLTVIPYQDGGGGPAIDVRAGLALTAAVGAVIASHVIDDVDHNAAPLDLDDRYETMCDPRLNHLLIDRTPVLTCRTLKPQQWSGPLQVVENPGVRGRKQKT